MGKFSARAQLVHIDSVPLKVISASAPGIRGRRKVAQGKANIHMTDLSCVIFHCSKFRFVTDSSRLLSSSAHQTFCLLINQFGVIVVLSQCITLADYSRLNTEQLRSCFVYQILLSQRQCCSLQHMQQVINFHFSPCLLELTIARFNCIVSC